MRLPALCKDAPRSSAFRPATRQIGSAAVWPPSLCNAIEMERLSPQEVLQCSCWSTTPLMRPRRLPAAWRCRCHIRWKSWKLRWKAEPQRAVADSAVSPSWYAENMRHLEDGADCVAGYIDAEAPEIVSLGAAFLERGRREDMYLRLVAEIYALCDPRPHDPWPNHRVSSGASIAVTIAAYDSVGGMPDRALGEDGAFTALLEEKGFRVRHSPDVCVLTSCRLNGRAAGGAADTMRHRRAVPNAPCDDELEPALATLRRAVMRGLLRQASHKRTTRPAIERLYGEDWRPNCAASTFTDVWKQMEARHPKLRRGLPLRPSDLPRQIAVAKFILRHLRLRAQTSIVQGDKCLHAKSSVLVDA